MRTILCGDVIIAARALLAAPQAARAPLCDMMLHEAQAADLYRRKRGAAHGILGDGSLAAAAAQYPLCPQPPFGDPEFLRVIALLTDRILHHRNAT